MFKSRCAGALSLVHRRQAHVGRSGTVIVCTLAFAWWFRANNRFAMMDPTPPAGRVATERSYEGNQSTEAAERALLALVSTGDRCAMDQLYIRFFARLSKFFQNMAVRRDLVEDLINDTMLEVWNEGASMGPNSFVLFEIMRLAYSRVEKHFAETRADEPHSQRDVQERELLTLPARDAPSDLQIFLSKLPVEERAVVHLVYASGCSRQETADIMTIACDSVDMLLRDVRASAKLHFSVTSAQVQGMTGREHDKSNISRSASADALKPLLQSQEVSRHRESNRDAT
jgi:DNA-directed RNA polymerase specialized sigma24 family protein